MSGTSSSAEVQWRNTPLSNGPDLTETKARGSFVVHKTTTDAWFVNQTIGKLDISQRIVIPQTGLLIDDEWWDIETGGAFRRKLGERKSFGVSGSIGSASNDPFHSIYETAIKLNGLYQIPSKETNSWIFLFSYSNNRHFANNIPIPGFVYWIHAPKDGLDILIGIPFFGLNYRPTPKWSHRLGAFGPDNLMAESSYKIMGPLEVYGGFEWNNRAWFRANHEDHKKRLFLEQKRWSIGTRIPVSTFARIDIGSGYEYNREFYENRKTDDGIPKAHLKSAWTFHAKGSMRW